MESPVRAPWLPRYLLRHEQSEFYLAPYPLGTRHSGPSPFRSFRPAMRRPSRISPQFLLSRYWRSARWISFSRPLGTWTGFPEKGSRPVWYMQVEIVKGVGVKPRPARSGGGGPGCAQLGPSSYFTNLI